MTKQEFADLGITEKLDYIADQLIFARQENQSLEDNFKTDRTTPVQPKINTPPGFETIFGPEPDKANSSQRAVWLNQLKNFGGIIPDFYVRPDYPGKSNKSDSAGLGYPIGYIFNGEFRVTFSKKPAFWRPIEWYNNYFDLLVDAARNSR